MAELIRNRQANALKPLPTAGDPLPVLLPLIGPPMFMVRTAVYELAKELARQTAERVRLLGPEHEGAAAHIERASPHWMRHTAGSHQSGTLDLTTMRDNLSHETVARKRNALARVRARKVTADRTCIYLWRRRRAWLNLVNDDQERLEDLPRHRRNGPARRVQLDRYERDDGPLSAAAFRALGDSIDRLPSGPALRSQALFGSRSVLCSAAQTAAAQ